MSTEYALQKYLPESAEIKIDNRKVITEDPVTIVLAALTATISVTIVSIIISLISAASIRKDGTLSKKYTNKVNKILKENGIIKKVNIYMLKADFINAFSLIDGTIFATDQLKKLLTEEEMTAIFLHEANHSINIHALKMAFTNMPGIFLTLFILKSVIFTVFLAIGPFAIIAAYLIMNIIYFFADAPHRLIIGRRREIESDKFAAKMGYGKHLISALNKFEKHFSKNRKEKNKIAKALEKLGRVLDEHPPTRKRVEEILKDKKVYELAHKGNKVNLLRYIIRNHVKKEDLKPKESNA